MNPQSQSEQVIRSADCLVASGLLAAGSLLLLISSLLILSGGTFLLWQTALAFPAVMVHFFGWAALAGLVVEPKGGRPEDPVHLRRKVLVFVTIWVAFAVGLLLLFVVLPVAVFLFPYIPVVYAPVVLVHAGIFWWGSDRLREVKPRVLVRAAVLTLVAIAGVGLFIQLAIPALLFTFLPLAGLTGVGYLLAALGWWSAFRRDRVSGYHATPIRR